MSKIKIVGHASGSGVLTIAAPNTNTDRTITIPDVTGTLLDSGSDLPAANLTGTIASARIADDAITTAKLANSINTEIAANTAKVTNSTSASDLTSGTLPMARLSGTLPALDGSALTGIESKLLQYQYGVKGSNVNNITSNSNGNTPSTAPINVMTPVFNTGSSTSSIWEATAMVGLNNEANASNYNASMRLFVSYDGGSSWSRWQNPSAPSTEGDYLMYASGPDEYSHITINVINTLTPNQSNTKICAIGFSYESDNTRWNIHNGQGFTLSCKQYAT